MGKFLSLRQKIEKKIDGKEKEIEKMQEDLRIVFAQLKGIREVKEIIESEDFDEQAEGKE